MIQVTLSFTSVAEAIAALSKIEPISVVPVYNTVTVSAAGPAPTATKLEAKQPNAAAPAEAPGKPQPTAASESQTAAAPSPRTADQTPRGEAPAAQEPSEKPSAATTEPDAGATSAAEPFEYATLQKAVNERVAKLGKDKLLAIATKHGAKTFKDLPADKWALAHADVIALG